MSPDRFCIAVRYLLISVMVVLPANLVFGQPVVVDNSDSGFSVVSGTWDSGSYSSPYNTDYRWALTTGFTPPEPMSEVEWRPDLPTAGTYEVSVYYVDGTNRADNAPYTVHHAEGAETVSVNQKIGGGQWQIIGTYPFDVGDTGYVTLSNDANYAVVIADAVSFTLISEADVELTMEVSPAGAGTTVPAAGGPYTYDVNAEVDISAYASTGFVFDHWQVSSGASPASSTSPSTTVQMDAGKTIIAVFVADEPGQAEFRAFWADAFHEGFKSTSEIDAMISWALQGNYNAIIPEVLAYQDTGGSGHGAYWDSAYVPRASDISGSFDPLEYLVQQAHAVGIEVHPWLVSFRISTSWPPNGNSIVAAHPEWVMVPRDYAGSGPTAISGKYTFDPGSPDVQQYLMNIVRELCTNYQIDGIHWDYIRYTQRDAGYPSDLNYSGSTLSRFQQVTGYSGLPPVDGEATWDDFRRRTITEFVRRGMSEVATAENPRQPLRHTAALVTWYPAPPGGDFHQTRPYYDCYSDWEYWQSLGYLDATIPMAYFDENSYPSTYRSWVESCVNWATNYYRHTYIGPGIYMNTFADSAAQLIFARNAGADGFSTYSYQSTNDGGQPWYNWYSYAESNIFVETTPTPGMPWREPATATKGAVYGRVTDGLTGEPIDNATVTLAGFRQLLTDGNGHFLFNNVPASSSGYAVSLSAVAGGYSVATRSSVLLMPAGYTQANIALGDWLPGDFDVDGDVDLADFDHFSGCMTGPSGNSLLPECDLFDFDLDADIDVEDFAVFQNAFGQ